MKTGAWCDQCTCWQCGSPIYQPPFTRGLDWQPKVELSQPAYLLGQVRMWTCPFYTADPHCCLAVPCPLDRCLLPVPGAMEARNSPEPCFPQWPNVKEVCFTPSGSWGKANTAVWIACPARVSTSRTPFLFLVLFPFFFFFLLSLFSFLFLISLPLFSSFFCEALISILSPGYTLNRFLLVSGSSGSFWLILKWKLYRVCLLVPHNFWIEGGISKRHKRDSALS